MSVVLTADQIPQFWEAIKFACVNADEVDEKFLPKYLNRLLYQLLSSKAQCFVRLSESRQLQALAVTKILTDDISDEKTLFVRCLYSFEKVEGSLWRHDMELLRKFASKNKCTTITCQAVSTKAILLVESIGMRFRSSNFILNI